MDVIGEWWTPMILRDVFLGLHKFDQLHDDLGISRNILTQRLATLVEHQVLERVEYHVKPSRYEYHLTTAGRHLVTYLAAVMEWGDEFVSHREFAQVQHGEHGHRVHARLVCDECGEVDALDAHIVTDARRWQQAAG